MPLALPTTALHRVNASDALTKLSQGVINGTVPLLSAQAASPWQRRLVSQGFREDLAQQDLAGILLLLPLAGFIWKGWATSLTGQDTGPSSLGGSLDPAGSAAMAGLKHTPSGLGRRRGSVPSAAHRYGGDRAVQVAGCGSAVGTGYRDTLGPPSGPVTVAVCRGKKIACLSRHVRAQRLASQQVDFADGGQHHNLSVDFAGNPTLLRLRCAFSSSGTAVVGDEEHGSNVMGMGRQVRILALSPFISQRLTMFLAKQRVNDLETVAALIDAGTVQPCLDRTFPLDEAQDGVRHLEALLVRGKVSIKIQSFHWNSGNGLSAPCS